MIDWISVGSNALWILGCAIGLATLSYASWEASVYDEKFTTRLKRTPVLASLNLAGLLFSLGLAATADSVIEKILWLVLAVAFGGLLIHMTIISRLRQ
jgi:hypothetical protein